MRPLLALALLGAAALGASMEKWKSRTIYQILTDRFATSDGSTPYCNLQKYCGGTWKGVERNLDYIQGMGFDAVWISPVISNTPDGYHGYWTKNFYAYNEHFGTEEDLKSLLSAVHSRGMYLMVDIIANHAGPVGYDYSSIYPFNKAEHYHDCNGCPSDCNIANYMNDAEVEHCRLSGLPDLNQSNPFVRETLIDSLLTTVVPICDGIRVDTVPEVPKDFWAEMQNSLGTFCMGETYDGRIDYVAGFQGPLNSVLSYPLFFTARNVFAYGQSMRKLGDDMTNYRKHFKDIHSLGSFMDNHDQVRFLNVQSDTFKYKNALVWTLYTEGIPIIYYGTEQGFNGGVDPNNREALWTSGFDTSKDLYQFLKTSINYRKKAKVWSYEQVERWQDDNFYAFTRGSTLVCLTNVGTTGATQTRTITYHEYPVGTKLCNIYWPNDDCITVTSAGITVTLLHGEPKVYYPVN